MHFFKGEDVTEVFVSLSPNRASNSNAEKENEDVIFVTDSRFGGANCRNEGNNPLCFFLQTIDNLHFVYISDSIAKKTNKNKQFRISIKVLPQLSIKRNEFFLFIYFTDSPRKRCCMYSYVWQLRRFLLNSGSENRWISKFSKSWTIIFRRQEARSAKAICKSQGDRTSEATEATEETQTHGIQETRESQVSSKFICEKETALSNRHKLLGGCRWLFLIDSRHSKANRCRWK